MNRTLSLVGLAGILVLLFLAGMYFTQGFLRRETERLREETLRARRAQLDHTLALVQAGPPPWSDDFVRRLAAALVAEVEVVPPGAAPARPARDQRWQFDQTVTDNSGQPAAIIRVRFTPPAMIRLAALHQKVAAIMLTTALVFIFVFGLLVLGSRRALVEPEPDNAAAGAVPAPEAPILRQLAAQSSRQSVELEHERTERQRAEADLLLKQVLLNRALQEKIDMGRDLHDGLIQSLYAAGLTLQAARKLLATDPEKARLQIETSVTTINNAIREVRGYITGLAPEKLRERTFTQSVAALTESLAAGHTVQFDLRLDDVAAQRLNDAQMTDLLQIVREAVSNSLRHGAPTAITLRLHESDNLLCLLVQDNGKGFDPARAAGGHGLGNMRARAERLGATLTCASEPAGGTRLVLSFSAPPPSAS